MNTQILAVIISEGGRILTEFIRTRPPGLKQQETVRVAMEPQPSESSHSELASPHDNQPDTQEKATAIPTGCVPCAMGHLGTCTGLFNEAMRFASKDGLQSTEVIDRVNMCMDELNAMERVDLRPEMIAALPDWEKRLAQQALTESRSIRHGIEGLKTVDELETLAASTQSTRQDIGREWFQQKLNNLSPEEKKRVEQRVAERLGHLGGGGMGETGK